MDSLTHILLGASAGYALFRRPLGRSAAAIGALAAFIPDADVFIRDAQDPLLAVEFHRQFTHSLLFSLLGSCLVAALWWRHRAFRKHWALVGLCALTGYLSHCLLDAATTYGTQLFWPFSDRRVSWDWIAIVDPLATATILVGLAWALWRQQAIPARIGLGLFLAYVAFGGLQHARARAALHALAQERGHAIERAAIMPTLANNVVWRSLYESDGRIYSDRFRVGWLTRVRVWEGGSVPKATLASLTPIEQQRNQGVRAFERFAWFSDHWVARVPSNLDVIGDMRYSASAEPFAPLWGIRFTPPGTPLRYAWEQLVRVRRLDVAGLWSEIRGEQPGYHPLRLR